MNSGSYYFFNYYFYTKIVFIVLMKKALSTLFPINPNHPKNPSSDNQTLNLKCITSPSFTTYSFPSMRSFPFSRQAASDPY